jgi:HEPN domain-containing protein
MTTKEEVARRWMNKAEHDLLNARHTLKTMGANCPYDTVCFHAQQAAEKSLKALLSYLGIGFSKTHDIGELIVLLPAKRRPKITATEIERLTSFAVEARYPDVDEELTRDDAARALKSAEKVRKSVVVSMRRCMAT